MSDNNNYLRIEGEVLRLGQRAVSIRNICEVSTSVPQAAFPSSVLYLGLAGVVCLLLSGMESTLAVVGLLLVAGAAAAYYSWKQRNASAPKGASRSGSPPATSSAWSPRTTRSRTRSWRRSPAPWATRA